MGQKINSDALTEVYRVLGIRGTGAQAGLGSPFTELDDSRLDQVVDVNPYVRRSRAPAGTTGWFVAAFDLTMGAGVTTENAQIDVYRPGAALVNAPFKAAVPRDQDIWMIGHSAVINAATASNFTSAGLRLECPATQEGYGIDEAGAKPTPNVGNFQLASWDSTIVVAGRQILITANGDPYYPLGIRLRRGQLLNFEATASNAVGIRGTVIMAQLPAGLGQDIGP